LGESVKVRVDSFPKRILKERSKQINRSAEFTPRNVQTVEERIQAGLRHQSSSEKNDNEELRPGMSADVTFPNVPK